MYADLELTEEEMWLLSRSYSGHHLKELIKTLEDLRVARS
jgi:hypothetical protein